MKNTLSFVVICFLALTGAFAQKGTPVTVDGQTLYRKSSEKLTANSTGCVLCEDKKLTKNCREYVCDNGGNCNDFGISIVDLKKIARDGSAEKISGFQHVPVEGTVGGLSYREGDQKSVTFIYKEGNNIVLECHKVSSTSDSSGSSTTPVFKETKPAQDPKPKLLTTINDITFGIQKDKMKSANKNAETVKQLL